MGHIYAQGGALHGMFNALSPLIISLGLYNKYENI